MDAPVPLILAALLAAGALVARGPRARAAAMLGALVLAPVILGFHIADSDQVKPLRDHPSLAVAGAVGAVVVLAVLAVLFDRRPSWLPVAAAATLPFRVPIASGGSTANLLVPLYLVVAAGARWPTPCRGWPGGSAPRAAAPPGRSSGRWPPAWPSTASSPATPADFGHALENVVFFYVPFALLFALVARVAWTPKLARVCLGVLVVLALALVGRRLRRVRDAPPVPQPEGHRLQPARGLLPGQLAVLRPQHLRALPGDRDAPARGVAAVGAPPARGRGGRAAARGAVGRAGADLLAVELHRPARRPGHPRGDALERALGARSCRARALVVAVVFVALAPGAVHLELGNSKSADKATSGRYDLIKGGLKLFKRAPLVGQGSGSFAREYRRAEHVSPERAASASHTIPVTVAAEQGLIGLRRLPRAAGGGAGAAVPRGAARARARRGGGGLRGPGGPFDDVRRVPGGPARRGRCSGAGTAMALWAAVREPAPA